jgi:hypothetical protein
MKSRRIYIIGGLLVAVLALAAVGGGIAIATGAGDDDQPITGSALEDCTAAALAAHPGGTVTETETGDDGAAYGVEVKLEDGSQVEVNLDENCKVIGQEQDDDGPNDEDGPDDDD